MPQWKTTTIRWLAHGFGLGLAPIIPGTFGTLLGLPLAFALHATSAVWESQILQVLFYVGAAVGMCLLSHAIISRYERLYAVHDPSEIVIDEVCGVAIALMCFPPTLFNYGMGFLVFRVLDMAKPGPIGWIDKHWPGASGTLYDDVLAGIVTAGILGIICLAFPTSL